MFGCVLERIAHIVCDHRGEHSKRDCCRGATSTEELGQGSGHTFPDPGGWAKTIFCRKDKHALFPQRNSLWFAYAQFRDHNSRHIDKKRNNAGSPSY